MGKGKVLAKAAKMLIKSGKKIAKKGGKKCATKCATTACKAVKGCAKCCD